MVDETAATAAPEAEAEIVSDQGEGTADSAASATPAPNSADEAGDENWDTPPREEPDAEGLILRLDGYEGPLDMLLDLARRQKVDLRQISITGLVDQYLEFIEEAKRRDLELAADYLVMASWLTYLKSRLLLPKPKSDDEEPTADELSARLTFQLQRLDAMRKAAEELVARPQLGLDVFPRGVSALSVKTETAYSAELYDLLKAYAKQRIQNIEPVYTREVPKVYSLEEARDRLSRILGDIPDWCLLAEIGGDKGEEVPSRSVIASNFSAALEHAKAGRIQLRQSAHFAPLYLRAAKENETPHE